MILVKQGNLRADNHSFLYFVLVAFPFGVYIMYWNAINTVSYFPRRLTRSATMKRDIAKVKRIWKGILVGEGGCWGPMFVCFVLFCCSWNPKVGSLGHDKPVVWIKIWNQIKYSSFLSVLQLLFPWILTVDFPGLKVPVLPCNYEYIL